MSKAIPKLRFKGFEGEWDYCALGEKANSIASGKVKPKENGDYLVYGSTGVIGRNNEYSHDGDFILVARVGANAGTINRVKGKYAVTDNTLVIDLKNDFLVPFCEAYLKRFGLNRLIFGSGQPLITGGQLKALKISFPSLPEQQKIASFLSAVDEKIQQLTRKKELLEQYKKGVMQQLFSGKLRFKDENGKPYPKWEEKRLGEVLEIGSGRDYKHLRQGNIPVFGTGGLMTMVDDFLYDGETVCIGRKGTIDKPMFHKGKIWTVDTLFYTHSFKKVLPKFVYYVFQLINWREHNEASGVPSLSKTTIEKLKFKFPSVEEQQKIASFLSAIDAKIESVANQIAQAQTFKKGLLQQMFV
jgi:type I restriction enzyme, S subunit